MNRRLPLILVAGVLALCLIGVVVVGIVAGSGFGAVAYTVGDTKVSQQSVNDDLATLADHDSFATQNISLVFRSTAGAVSSTATADWLTVEIYRQLGTRRLAARGDPITPATRKAAVDAAVARAGPAFARELRSLPTDLRNRLGDVLVLQSALEASVLEGADVTVDPKYGFWNAKQGRVCPPTGCPAASSGTGG